MNRVHPLVEDLLRELVAGHRAEANLAFEIWVEAGKPIVEETKLDDPFEMYEEEKP
jgi:hypothetical protein